MIAMTETTITFGQRCRAFRHLRELTMLEVATKMGMDASTVWRLENDRVKPELETVVLLSEALQVAVDVLMGLRPFSEEETWIRKQ